MDQNINSDQIPFCEKNPFSDKIQEDVCVEKSKECSENSSNDMHLKKMSFLYLIFRCFRKNKNEAQEFCE